MSISKVKSCQGAGDWSNEHGTFYKFEYTMEDGATLTASHKKQEGFPIGAEVDYEIKGTNEHGSYGSVKKPDSGYGNSSPSKPQVNDDTRQLMIVRQSSLKVALDLCLHNSKHDERPNPMIDEIEVIELAGSLVKWVMGEKKEENISVEPIAEELVKKLQDDEKLKDLPF